MPEMQVLGNQIKPPDILGNLSNMLGIKQQMQSLQTGQYQQQAAQAIAVKQQQEARETQAGAQLLSDPVKNGILDEHGQPKEGAQAVIMAAMPTTGADHVDKIIKAAQSKVEYNNSQNNLRGTEKAEINGAIAGPAADPNANLDDVESQLKAVVESKKGTPTYDDYKTIGDISMSVLRNANSKGQAAEAGKEPWRQAAINLSRGMLGPQAVGGPGGIANPQSGTNAASQLINRNQVSGDISLAGQSGQTNINPTSSAVAGLTGRATGTAGSDIDRSNEVAGLQQQSAAAIPLTQRIDQLAHDISSGKVAKMISETGNYFGISSMNEARSQLNKDLGQVKGLAVAKAGSDSRAATILEGYPTDTTPEGTIHAAMDYIRGTARQNLARGKLLSQYQKEDPQGLRGFQAADNILGGSTNPLMHEYLSLKPEEQAGFYRRNFSTPQEAQAFKDHVNALKKHTNVFASQ